MTEHDLARFAQAWRRGDVAAIVELMTDDAVYSPSSGQGATIAGIAQLRREIPAVLAAHAHLRFVPGEAWIAGQRGVAHWSYTRADDPEGPTVLRGVDILAFRDGKVLRKDAYRKCPSDGAA